MKIKNGSNPRKMKKRKLLEMFLQTIDIKALWKFCVIFTCRLPFGKKSRINWKKYDQKS